MVGSPSIGSSTKALGRIDGATTSIVEIPRGHVVSGGGKSRVDKLEPRVVIMVLDVGVSESSDTSHGAKVVIKGTILWTRVLASLQSNTHGILV